jgi:hypothetical protein
MIAASSTAAKLCHPSSLNEVKRVLKLTPAKIMHTIAAARNPKERIHPKSLIVDFLKPQHIFCFIKNKLFFLNESGKNYLIKY